jgi:molybdenum cofactor cytidylyltransferase
MIRSDRTALILLAAGLSTRFGVQDKLAERLHDLPLGLHAARTAAALPFAARIAVVGPQSRDFTAYGFAMLLNDDPAAGQARSIALGVGEAQHHEIDAVLILLADMPFVTTSHLRTLMDAADDSASIVASATDSWSGPPTLFGSAHFTALQHLTGDRGARLLIKQARLVHASAAELADIDTKRDLDTWSSAIPPER